MPVSDSFDRVLKRFKKIATPYPRILVDGDVDCIVGSVGNDARVDVYTRHWEQLKKQFKGLSQSTASHHDFWDRDFKIIEFR